MGCPRCNKQRVRPRKGLTTPVKPPVRAPVKPRPRTTTAVPASNLRASQTPSWLRPPRTAPAAVVPSFIVGGSEILIRGAPLPAAYGMTLYRIIATYLKAAPDGTMTLIFETVGRVLEVSVKESFKCGDVIYQAVEGSQVVEMFESLTEFSQLLNDVSRP